MILDHNKAFNWMNLSFLMGNECPKCNGTKRVMQKDGTIRPCWDCLNSGAMDQHSKNVKDSGVRG